MERFIKAHLRIGLVEEVRAGVEREFEVHGVVISGRSEAVHVAAAQATPRPHSF